MGKKFSCLLGLLAGTGFCWAAELKEAEITTLKNLVEHDPGTGAAPAKLSEKIQEKSKVSTAAASMAELTFTDASITRVGANTSFSFQSKERLVKLDRGTVLINTPPGAGGATVDCGGVTAAVTGTTFMASVDASGNKMFVLLEGAGGMKVTAGGKTTMVKAGQAASVGGGADGAKKEDSGGGAGEKKAGGDQPAADKKESGGDTAAGGDKPTAGGPSAGPDATGGGGTGGGGERKAAALPTVQVFDVDVKKVVASTPLIQAFEKPLPSAQKIQATVEVQQAKVAEGKMESLGVEIVAVKSDGDVLVGAPKVVAEAPAKKEEVKAEAPAKKEDVVAKKEEGGPAKKEDGGMKPEPKADGKVAGGPSADNLDISTAAGGGGGAPAAPTGTSVAAAAPPSPPAAPSISAPSVNIGQIINQRPQELAPVALTLRANDFSRAFGAPNPDFGFSIKGNLLAGHSVVTDLRTTANNFSGVSGSPYEITLEGLRILDGSGGDVTKRYNLTSVSGALTIFQAEQSVNFALSSNLTFGTEAGLVAGVRGGEVSFEVVSGSAKIEGGKLVATSGTGSVVVRASTPGNENYLGANAEQTITLAKAEQQVVITPPAVAVTGGAFALAASGNVAGPVVFSILEEDGRANVGPDGVVTLGKILGADTFTVRAEVEGSENYLSGKTDLTVALGRNETAILEANPTQLLLNPPVDLNEKAALAKFFYFTGKAEGVAGPSRFFSDLSSSTRSLADYSDQSVALYDGRPGEFYAMGTLNGAGPTHDITLGSDHTVIFANQINLGRDGLGSATVLQKDAKLAIPDFNAAGITSVTTLNNNTGPVTPSTQNPAMAFSSTLSPSVPVDISPRSSTANGALTGVVGGGVNTLPTGLMGDPDIPFYVLAASVAINPADDFGMFAGDYKAYLTYLDEAGTGQMIHLLDRIGASVTDPEGSAANGIEATFSDYGTGQAINSATGDPIAGTFQPGSGDTLLQGTMGEISAAGSFFMTVGDLSQGGLGILDNWSVTLAQRVKISVLDGVGKDLLGKDLLLVSGLGGTQVNGTLWDLGQANLDFMSAGEMEVNDSEFYNLGRQFSLESAQDLSIKGIAARGEAVGGTDVTFATGGSLTLENSKLLVNGDLTATAAVGPVELNGEAGEDVLIQAAQNVVITGADLIETSAGGAGVAPAPTNLAVIRTGDSLEMRNVVIRGFSETKLESTKAGSTGRVLLSGSSVRDFKIKELAGMAVNADAKIQMMAYDATGGLKGTMTVEGRLPVAAKLASAIDKNLTDTLRDKMVDAKEIDLAARRINLSNATMVAMDAIHVRAQTILVQNSFMTVIRKSGSINMYVQSGLVNQNFGSVVDGRLNFAGLNTFTIGNNSFAIGNQTQLNAAYGTNLIEIPNGETPQAGKVNVLKM